MSTLGATKSVLFRRGFPCLGGLYMQEWVYRWGFICNVGSPYRLFGVVYVFEIFFVKIDVMT